MIPSHFIEKFMRESNAIEGEHASCSCGCKQELRRGALNPGDLRAAETWMKLMHISAEDLKAAHKEMFGHRMPDAGAYRIYNVRVGKFQPCDWKDVEKNMREYFKRFKEYDAWTAHNKFEKIHPFGDGNGRMGRLLWLWKAENEGYKFGLPFLHAYYYQTLSHVHK